MSLSPDPAEQPAGSPRQQRTVLTIAGFDPSSGAGVTADLQTFAAHGRFGTSCITALTVQSTQGVYRVEPVSPATLTDTLSRLAEDLPPAGIKIGMLGTADVILTVADWLEPFLATHPAPVIVDPVLRSSSGADLLAPAALDVFRSRLLRLATVLTPNRAELALLAPDLDLLASAQALRRRIGGCQLVVTGGDSAQPVDHVLTADGATHLLFGTHIPSRSTHGTGCAFSSSLLCHLLDGHDLLAASRRAKHFVEEGIRRAPGLGHGKGPLDLLWPLHAHPPAP